MQALIIDSETTGLLSNHTLPLAKQPQIVELCMVSVDLNFGERTTMFDSFINPGKPLPEETIRITGIKDEDLKEAPMFPEVSGNIKAIIENASVVIAHNASYDKEMIDIEFERLGQKVNWNRIICSVESTIYLKGFRQNLQGLHEYLFGEPFSEAHRARTDVAALARCAVELFKRGEL